MLYRHLPEKKGVQEENPASDIFIMRNMMQYVDRHVGESVSLEQVAAAGNVSASKCYHLFHEYMGQTPIEYLTRLRLARSVDLMKSTQMNLLEIAISCGVKSSSYYAFFRCIRR